MGICGTSPRRRAHDCWTQAGDELRTGGSRRGVAAALVQAGADAIRAGSLLRSREEIGRAHAGDEARQRVASFLAKLLIEGTPIGLIRSLIERFKADEDGLPIVPPADAAEFEALAEQILSRGPST